MTFNINGVEVIIDTIQNNYAYVAYGTGDVTDNSTSLVAELNRIARSDLTAYQTHFENLYVIPGDTSNLEVLKEYGLARNSTGDIATTFLSYPMEKNASYEFMIMARIIFTLV